MLGKILAMESNPCIYPDPHRASTGPTSAAAPASAVSTAQTFAQHVSMKIRLSVDSVVFFATLDDNAAARGFATLLPLSLTLTDYAVLERIAELPRKLSVTDAPAGITPKAGDINYYAPWGNLAIFVGNDRYARGLARLGRVDSGLPSLQRPGPFQIRIEHVTD